MIFEFVRDPDPVVTLITELPEVFLKFIFIATTLVGEWLIEIRFAYLGLTSRMLVDRLPKTISFG